MVKYTSDVASNRHDKFTPTLLFAIVVHRDTAVQNSDTNVVFFRSNCGFLETKQVLRPYGRTDGKSNMQK